MRIALFSDIHANDVALSAVLDFLNKNHPVDKIWCMGDIIGYGPEPVKTVEIAMRLFDFWIAGNHEEYWFTLLKREENKTLDRNKSIVNLTEELRNQGGPRKEAIHTLLLHLDVLRKTSAGDWLQAGLSHRDHHHDGPQVVEVEGFSLIPVHATFSNPTGGYSEPWKSPNSLAPSLFRVNERLLQYEENGVVMNIVNGLADRLRTVQSTIKSEKPYLVIFGHTHVPGIYHYKNGHAQGALPPGYGIPVPIGNYPMAINPGSLGHPSDTDPRAAFAILDTKKCQVTFYRVPYNLKLIEDKLYMLNYPDVMWDEIKNAHLRTSDTQILGDFDKDIKRLAASLGH